MSHLGSRVSALLDGQLSAEEAERAWQHVHACHLCRDHVEREGWVKTRLAGLSFDAGVAPAGLKAGLRDGLGDDLCGMPPGDVYLAMAQHSPRRSKRTVGLVALGGGAAAGAAFMGVLALGAAPADAPTIDRRTPTTPVSHISTSTPPAKLPAGNRR